MSMKNKKIKLIAMLLLLVMIVPIFIACGDGDDTTTSADTTNENADASTTEKADETEPATDPVTDPVTDPATEAETEPATEPVPVVPEDPPYDHMIAAYNMENELKDSVTGKSGILWNGASLVDDAERGGKVLFLNNADVTTPGDTANGALGYQQEGQWAELADPYIPDSDAMTVSIWFKVVEHRTWARAIDLGDAKAQNALADGEVATVGPNRFLNIAPTNGSFTIGTININDSTEGIPNNRDRVFADLVDESVWVHACYVISKDGTPNVLYINGVAYQSTHGGEYDDPEPAEFSPKDILESEEGLRNAFLGRSAYENNGDQIFYGYIDDVTIFDVALTANQVAGLKAADLKSR